jgi:hypothetical protein
MRHGNSQGRRANGSRARNRTVINGDVEPLGVPPKVAFRMIGCGVTKGYQYIGNHDLEIYKLGRATRITLRSVHQLVERLVAASNQRAA